MGAERASAEMSGVTMPTVSARNQYAFEMSRQFWHSPAVWMTDSMPEYARMQLAMPTVTIATACGSPNPVTERATLVALSRIASGLPGAMCSRPSAIRLSSTMAATMKMPKVTRAFSRMPRMLSPATAQMMARMTPWYSAGPSGRNAVPLITALTVEMQAVRMYDTMIDATAMKEATGPSTK